MEETTCQFHNCQFQEADIKLTILPWPAARWCEHALWFQQRGEEWILAPINYNQPKKRRLTIHGQNQK